MEEENLHQQKNPKPKKQSKLSLGSLGNVNWDWGQTWKIFFQLQMCVLRLIHVIQSVEKIEKILHSQGTKELSSLEGNR